ncbi:GEVED domain-containing protein [Subsaxibacter sp. CAU 1640]|uniref:reprolysin-like metallopeptidase n=1 Tax=Subsaxibacter sp. CAU 1640 TaxID=2933271 RepID=UPI002002F65F|nr:zinc-dependent metalloprotease family protein [Subsaxibacter sp. CAU 1640]MCK7589585.1 GEVED domain-containing protein [Subsaxibacter sp. CAU 1640]
MPTNTTFKQRVSTPTKYRTVVLDTETFLDYANGANGRFSDNAVSNLIITLPLPNGQNETFTLEDSELMHPELAAKFPQLKTYSGKGLTDKTAILRLTYSPYFGLSGMILSGKHSTVYIDPITIDNRYYMSYYRNDLPQSMIDFECSTEDTILNRVEDSNNNSERVAALGDCNLRRYRLAQSCTGEYAQYHISQAGGTTGTTVGDKAIVQAAMNVTMNRVNGIYERDLGITMQFVPNNDLIIYLNASTDPWTNEWNTRTAQTIDSQIGVANYDIGHNFNTTGGGNAGCIDCVCLAVSQSGTHKGRGYTGRSAPIGDPFDIDYVAHEMGHQFGGYHVQSSSNCRSGSGSSEVEVGSGSTIMGYAGICNPNVQSNSDDYFAYVNIRDIVTSINFGNGSSCAQLISSGNGGPNANAGLDYSIPISTPFRLEGTASDPDDSGLTYCWEQNDPENPSSSGAPTSTRTVGPMFRSLQPVAVPHRYIPNINAIVNNTTPTFEVLPSISRSMDFSFIVRDNNTNSGCTASDLMTVTTVAAAGPFVVTSPNTNVTWNAGSLQNITWNVAGTTAAPISCTNVDIYLSTDGGFTYPITIATNTPNDGSEQLVIPNNPGSQCRIMVKASNNIFFDISNSNFTIGPPTPCTSTVPTGLTASNVAINSATLSWNQVSGATYDLRYRIIGNSTWITLSVSALTTNLTGLNPSTNYEAQVRSKCSGGSNSSYSASLNFTTLAIPACTGAQIATYPYLETFNSGIGAWTQGTGDNSNWTLDANGTPTANTGPSNDITGGGNYLYFEANGFSSGNTAILISPCYDLSSLSTAYFSFYYHMYGNSMGTLNLEITTDNGGSWTNVFTRSGNQGNVWNIENINLNGYLGQTVKFRFIGVRGTGNTSDMAIDHIGLSTQANVVYCNSNGNNTADEYIGRVQLNTLDNNNSGPGTTSTGYSNFTSNGTLTTNLIQGTQYTITITPVWTGTVYPEGYGVWIDYNKDGDFNDSGEQVWTQSASTASPVSGTFVIPTNTSYGSTRMRVSLKYNGTPSSCESFAYGEVEDYTVNLSYNGLLFTNNAWTPNAPSASTSALNALVLDGTFNLNSPIALNNLTINNGATMNVQPGQSVELNGNLTSNGNFILNSSSTQYSSLIPNGTVSGNVAYRRHVNINQSSGGNDLISAPLIGQTFGDFAAANSNIVSNPNNATEKLFGHFDKSTGTYLTYDTAIPAEASTVLSAGIGYRAASTDDGTFEFVGTVSTSVVNSAISNSGPAFAPWNLIGNPYPSYIKLSDFLNANISEFLPTSAAIYGYDGNAADGWKIMNLAYSLANPNTIITPGQGFLVTSKVGGGTMVFNPSFRTIASGNAILDDDFIEGREVDSGTISYLSLTMSTASNSSKTDFYFTDNASRSLDIGYDANVFNGVAPNYAIYSHLVEDSVGNDLAIQSVSFNDVNESLIIPLGVNASQGQQISIGIQENTLPSDVDVYLEDQLTNTFTLLNTNEYSFTANNNLLGIGRFYLRFGASTLGNAENNLEELLIYATSSPKQIIIKGMLSESTKAIVYDIQGRQMLSTSLVENVMVQNIDVNSLSSGVYIVKIQGKTTNISRKIVVK